MTAPFSERMGVRQVKEVPITVRNDAPYKFRGVLVDLAYECGFQPKQLRSLICKVLRERPDDNNWSEGNVKREVQTLLDHCEWYHVYDVAEAIAAEMQSLPYTYELEKFTRELNDFFVENGIGWKLTDTRIEARGDEVHEQVLRNTDTQLLAQGFITAQNELHEALHDLSRRPTPDTTGAVQHSMAALECVARKCCGEENATLGEILRRHHNLIPKPLDQAVTKIWGYASENARHISEGRKPDYEEAELVVGVVAAVVTYLSKKTGA